MSVNKVILLGNLGSNPEVNFMQSGEAVARFSVATSSRWTDKATGEKREETEWHRVSCFKREAEIAAEYLKKGHRVYLEGRLRTRKYTDKDGVERYATEIIAQSLQLLTSKAEAQAMGSGE